MGLTSGNRLGPYEILAAIGAGGMGEVYRARDAKLGRDVALKVLPETFAHDRERMERFQREAKLLASLNHPNIATVYGLEGSASPHALVMELVGGPTLADRIRQGPIPIDEALPIAKQISDALEYAHEQGVVHRDLKPSNVKLTLDDTVKILDFGLAKALERDEAGIAPGNSPTISELASKAGALLGTPAYMSPEQARGKAVDRRADIWAFGCVLYEMLTGSVLFEGASVADTLAAVVREDPDWSRLPAATPIRVTALLQRCLQKDPKKRLRDIGDARISLDEILSGAPEFVQVVREKPSAPADLMRLQIPVPENVTLASTGVFALSPDGRQLVFSGISPDGVLRIWVRPLNSLEAHPLPGIGLPNSFRPPFFWSFDSRYIALDTGGKLKKIDVSGGPAQTVCDVRGLTMGGAWNRDGLIVFGEYPGGLMRVSASGGSAAPVTTVDASRQETFHGFPSFLPDGRHFTYLRYSDTPGNTGIFIGSLDVKAEKQNLKQIVATTFGAVYVGSPDADRGQLLFFRDGTLLAQPFDADQLEVRGEPVSLAEQLGFFLSFGFFSASVNGVLVCRTGGSGAASQLTWFDLDGKVLGSVGEPGTYIAVALSPDGERAVVSRFDYSSGKPALWLLDLSRGTITRFTSGVSSASLGTWSPDGSRIFFASNRNGVYDLYQKLASGVKEEELLLQTGDDKRPTSCSPDGRFLLYRTLDPKTRKRELWLLPLEGDRKPFPFLRTEFKNVEGQFSPDGRLVAYVSDESGHRETYVRTFSPDDAAVGSHTGGKWQISTGGGNQPRWRRDGKELYYLAPDGKLMAVEIEMDPVFRLGMPKALFRTPPQSALSVAANSWNPSPDGKRFLFAAPTEQGVTPFTVVLNWQGALKK
jgi:serine/threonine protein kinase